MAAPSPNSELARLMARFPRAGRVAWIGLRTAREAAVRIVDHAEAIEGKGLAGDRYMLSTSRGGSGKRGITLVQAEHLPAIAALSGRVDVAPELLRRNVVVSGITLVALKDRRFRIGDEVARNQLEEAPRIAVVAVLVERVAVEAQVEHREDAGVEEAPVLHRARFHHDARPANAVDHEQGLAARGGGGDIGEALELARGLFVDRRLEHERAFLRGGDLRNLVDRTLDDEHAGHAAADVHRARPVQVRVIPIRARRMILAQAVLVLPGLAGLDSHARIVHDEVAVQSQGIRGRGRPDDAGNAHLGYARAATQGIPLTTARR